jgi:Holliday junction resolvase RusA-like endonuclease
MTTNFFIAGIPRGQPRVKAFRFGEHARVYTPRGDHDNWRDLVLIAAQEHKPERPMEGSVNVEMVFGMPRPKWHYTKKGLRPNAPRFHTGRPDLDNLEKLIMDALTQARFWRDDSQVAFKKSCKTFSERTGLHLLVADVEKED